MTTDEQERLRQNAAAMLALADGKNIEFRWLASRRPPYDTGEWKLGGKVPAWSFEDFEYRPAPEPTTRPWSKPEDVPLNCWLRGASNVERFISTIHSKGGCTDTGGGFKWPDLVDYTYSTDRRTWKKCEVEE